VPRLSLCLVVLALSATAAAGCGKSSDDSPKSGVKLTVLDNQRIEQAIEDSIRAKRHRASDAACPAGLPLKKDFRFTCEVKVGRQTVLFDVVETDDKGSSSWKARP
jgi:hypothetical protein